MRNYILLRDNRESGPFSIEELRKSGLYRTDLLWVEGESTCWLNPTELEELKDLVVEKKPRPQKTFVSWPKESIHEKVQLNPPPTTTRSSYQPVEEDEWTYPGYDQKKSFRKGRGQQLKNVFNVAALFCGLVAGAFLMKKAVDNFDTTIAEEQVPLTVIANETASNQIPVVEAPAVVAQNALQIVPVKENSEKTTKPAKPGEIKKQLTVKASDYSVGVFGGINNLELKIYNGSAHAVDRIDIAVQYLKPNGTVVETGNYAVYSVKPYSTKLLSVPDTKRGVKIKYRIVAVKSKDYNNAIKQV